MHVWRDRLNRWFTPVARRTTLSPNTITVIALLLNLFAAACFYVARDRPVLFLAGIVILIAGGLADALDGIVARVHGKATTLGDFFDHSADRFSDLSVVAGWMLGSGVRAELLAMGMIAVMLNGYVGTQIEATWHERNYESVGRGEFVIALVLFPIISYVLATNGWTALTLAHLRIAEWLTVALIAFAVLGIGQRLVLATRLERSR